MRRPLGLVLMAALMLVATAGLASAASLTYQDSFEAVSYSGSDGAIPWENPWIEFGESDGPALGSVHVAADPNCPDYICLHIFGEGEQFNSLGVKRYADLTGFGTAEVDYDLTRQFDESFAGNANAKLYVQITSDGSNWITLETLDLSKTDSGPLHRSWDVTEWISASFGVRYLVSGTLAGEVFIDEVDIEGTPGGSTTTTTQPTTTTTTVGEATTTTRSGTTTTTEPKDTTTTTTGPTTTTTPDGTSTAQPDDVTTTTAPETTTTTVVAAVTPAGPPPGTGIRETPSGVQADYEPGLYGEMSIESSEVLGLELTIDYNMGLEVIESSWTWILGLGLIVAAATVTGLERRWADKAVSKA